jgi:hypothetical protein
MSLFDVAPYIIDPNLEDRFGVPPFSILDTVSGRWRTRRQWWDSFDLESRDGRADRLTFSKGAGGDPVSQKIAAHGTTSTFDPVLTEIIYRWWSPVGGVVLDPFAGGSVRGCVAAITGRAYHGVDLSAAQIDANEDTAHRLRAEFTGPPPVWHEHDSSRWQPDIAADLVMSCPPYGTLERYSDDPRDLSTMRFEAFVNPYRSAIERSVARLREDRFAVFVVGNYREGNVLRDLVGVTVDAFNRSGATYYGDLVLKNATSTAAMRASATFNAGRKPITVHQHVCVFVKGDWRRAAAAAEQVDVFCGAINDDGEDDR